MDAVWTRTSESVLEHFNTNATQGLSTQLAEKHAAVYGRNGNAPLSDPFAPAWKSLSDSKCL